MTQRRRASHATQGSTQAEPEIQRASRARRDFSKTALAPDPALLAQIIGEASKALLFATRAFPGTVSQQRGVTPAT